MLRSTRSKARDNDPATDHDPDAGRTGVDMAVFIPAGGLALGFVLWGALKPASLASVAAGSMELISANFGWFFILATNGFLVFAIYLAMSRFGSIRLGRDGERPEFRTVSWISMMFAAGIGIGLIFYGVAEPMSHLMSPPPGTAEAGTEQAARVAMNQTFLHWGLHGWAIYAVAGLGMAYFGFRKGQGNLISSACRPVIGSRCDGPLGKLIDGMAVFATLFGVVPSLGLGAVQINSAMTSLWGIESSTSIALVIVFAMAAAMVLSAVTGVKRGVQFLANVAMVTSVILAVFVLVAGPTRHIADSMVESFGGYVTQIVPMSIRTGTFSQGEFVNGWTVAYWVWWIAWAPFVGAFIARISRGRTIKEFVWGVLLMPSGVSFVWFVIFGGSAMHAQVTGQADIAARVAESQANALFALLDQYPAAKLVTFVVMFLVALFFVSGMDAAAVVMGILSSRGALTPPRWVVVFWGVATGGAAAVLLVAGGLDAMQQAMLVMAAPFTLVMIVLCVGVMRALREEVPAGGAEAAPPAARHRDDAGVAPVVTDRDTVPHEQASTAALEPEVAR
ncbi:BCCT family transporter [Nocardioides sp. KC13]|uniref:BCCT family transporter n=2 Tax=Nocardioides turkmenicus TaxID=2711220 RepID=A0A6M1QSM0_9ACTN|nr:BCCT family transporter [Nocardioides sp. KC13]